MAIANWIKATAPSGTAHLFCEQQFKSAYWRSRCGPVYLTKAEMREAKPTDKHCRKCFPEGAS